MFLFALPHAAGRNEADICAPACWAANAIGPAQPDHCAQRDIRIGEIPDGFDPSLRLGERSGGFHRNQYDTDDLLCQVYYCPNCLCSSRRAARSVGQLGANSGHSQDLVKQRGPTAHDYCVAMRVFIRVMYGDLCHCSERGYSADC
jgi:hypothetical protein